MVTLKQIAEELNITPTAVSYALNGRHSKISPETRRRVLEVARELGYQPHQAARALKTGRTHAIAVLIRNPQSPYYAEVLHHVVVNVLDDDYQLLVQRVLGPHDTDELSARLHGSADGFMVMDSPHLTRALRELMGPRAALVSQGVFCDLEGDYVSIDLSTGVVEIMQHLLEIGCQRIAYLLDTPAKEWGDPRGHTYRNQIEKAGRAPEWIVADGQHRSHAHHALAAYIREHGAPDGLFCLNDEMAIGAHRALHEAGLRVPQDVALAGCDGVAESEYFNPPITTIVQPVSEMCALSWTFLKNRLQEPTLEPQRATLPSRCALRGSTLGFEPRR